MSRENEDVKVDDSMSSSHSERKRSIASDDHSPKSESLKRPRLEYQNKEFKDRGKRMLGMIFNTLNQFKKDTNEKSEAVKRREQIENKLQERLKQEKKELEEEIRQDDEIRRKKRIEEEKQLLKDLKNYCNKQNKYKSNFIKTKSTPHIYYLPAKLNVETKKILEEQKSEILEKISINTKPMELISPITPTPISAKSEDKLMKDSNIPERDEKEMSLSPSKKSSSDHHKEEESKNKTDDNDNEKSDRSNEDSKMTDNSTGEDDDQDLKIDDTMDEVQY